MRTSYNGYVRIILIESPYICYMMAECHEVLLFYDEVISISAISCASCRRVARVRRARAWAVVVRACADTRARTNKGAGGSEGARARVDRAAQVAIGGGRAHSGLAEAGLQRFNQAMSHVETADGVFATNPYCGCVLDCPLPKRSVFGPNHPFVVSFCC